MASGTRSSKRKSSPPLKKKRRINKDRSKKRNKLGRGKSNKVTRPDSYSDDESLSAASSMSYSSTDSDRRRSRSRTRKDTSKRRKKSRGRRLRSESSEDDSGHEVRTSKRTKKSADREREAKKKRPRRKRRREPSVSSKSCSTCEATDDSERENVRTEKTRGKLRRDESYVNEEQVLGESNPRRLRSIIIFAKECEEADKEMLDRDGHKEEIIYDHDDYPSPRSNESNDGGDAKKEPCKHDEIVASKVEVPERCDLSVNVSSTDAGSDNTDLEAVLRQKALENLMKFKGGLRANAKKPVSTKSSINDGEVKDSVGGVGALSVPCENIPTVGHNSSNTNKESSLLTRPAAESLQTLSQDSKMVNPSEEGSADDEELPVLDIPATESLLVDDKHKTRASTLRQRLGFNKLNQQLAPIPESSMLVSEPALDKDTIDETGQSSHDTKIVTDVVDTTTTELLTCNLVGENSNAQENKEGDSQFQKKTMSVMRGGEMVQVNYKVYIPKNTPALARRKLRR